MVTIAGTLFIGSLTGYRALANAPHENNGAAKNIFYQPQSAVAAENTVSGCSTAELPGGNADYSVYEQYGLVYDRESGHYTYHGDVVRFFNDPAAGAGFTNFFTGTVDVEAERDMDNNLIGVRECDAEIYDKHTKKHEKFVGTFPADASSDAVMENGDKTANIHTLRDYETYGISHNMEDGYWYYNGQRIHMFIDSGKDTVYLDDEGSIYLFLSKSSVDETVEIREISETDAQLLLQNNNSVGEDGTMQK